jgi:hypothetical protein
MAIAATAVLAVATGYLLRAATAPAEPPPDPPSVDRNVDVGTAATFSPDPDGTGAGFVAWARGTGPEPAWADQVGLYLGGEHLKSLGRVEAGERSAWRICAAYAGVNCPFSALDSLDAYDGPMRFTPAPPPTCRDTVRPLTPDVLHRPHADLVVAQPTGGGLTCHGTFDVELWSIDGNVFAVNLSIGGF